MLNALYYLWDKHADKNREDVEGKKLNLRQSIIFLIIIGIGICLYKFILDLLGRNRTLLDSASTVISVVANLLMMLRYREQWLLWIVIDIIAVIMWLVVGDFVMVIMWAVYLINAFYGYYNWTRIANEDSVCIK